MSRPGAAGSAIARRGAALLLGLVSMLAAGGLAQERDITPEGLRSERRVALVIGNAAYPMGALRNAVSDARAMAATLRQLNFDVLAYENLGDKDMRRAIDAFGERLRGSGVGVFFYSGHGLQVKGRNYLVPVDAKMDFESDVEYDAVDVGRALAKMEAVKNRLNIVILDACRNNPFEKAWRSTGGGGLAQMTAPSGTFIAYATAPGRTASDGTGPNGLYTGELLKALRVPGLTLEEVFKRVGQAVRDQTRGAQEPWIASSVYGHFAFALPKGEAAPGTPAPAPAVAEPRVTVVPRLGALVIRSPRETVEVWLGARRLGEAGPGSDLLAENVQAGAHPVRARVRRDGFKPWEGQVQVVADQRAEVVIDIEPLRTGPAQVTKGEDGAEMVLVPAGEFWMGSTAEEIIAAERECRECRPSTEAPRHRVTLDAFYIDRLEVTNALFERFVRATGHRTTAEREGSGLTWRNEKWQRVSGADWRSPRGPGTSAPTDHPVVQVSWHDAEAYCRWSGKRLPTEAEWEKAGRGADGRKYPWGDGWDPSKANGDNSVKTTRPVGSHPAAASPYGALDMAGNVQEWVADRFDDTYYQRSPERNPQGPDSGKSRVLRGGSWVSKLGNLRSASRQSGPSDGRSDYVGFRCARGS